MTLTLSEADVANVLKYEQLIPAMEKALSAFSVRRSGHSAGAQHAHHRGGKAILGHHAGGGRGRDGRQACVLLPKNAGTKMPTHLAMIMLFEPATGQPLAFLDGRLITEMRTAAVSAAVTKYLAPENAGVLRVAGQRSSGAGASAGSSPCLPVQGSEGMEQDPERAQRFATLHGAKAMDLEPAVRGADVIVTATNALEPFLKGEWLKQGAHVNAVGSPRPTWRELDDAAMHNTLIVDSREAVLESGDVILSESPHLCGSRRTFR